MAMTPDTWDNVDIFLLRFNHVIDMMVITSKMPTVTATTVIQSQIESTSFLKYCTVDLFDKSQFEFFYDNLDTQVHQYNMFLHPTTKMTLTDSGIPEGMYNTCIKMIPATLHTVFSQKDIINDSYSDTENTVANTTMMTITRPIIGINEHLIQHCERISKHHPHSRRNDN